MVLRDIIIEKLDRFYAMASMNPPEEMKMLNLENWHIALEGLSDKAIEAGFNAAVKEDVQKMLFPGHFRKLCIIPPRPNSTKIETGAVQTEETKSYGRKKLSEIIARLNK